MLKNYTLLCSYTDCIIDSGGSFVYNISFNAEIGPREGGLIFPGFCFELVQFC